ncbi:MAG: molybdenum cofactor biosynthesis protein MoaE [Oligoflexia bacterium]|nr:molybdenum cofactor biosynthesis protein MoaE [Oligoflexia bacterium]
MLNQIYGGNFIITEERIEKYTSRYAQAQDQVQTQTLGVGGVVTFAGIIRGRDSDEDGHNLLLSGIEYQCYRELAQREGDKILSDAREQFFLIDAFCVHRVGYVKVGEMAVWILTLAEHRQAAFLACEYIIETIKKQLPIWKLKKKKEKKE